MKQNNSNKLYLFKNGIFYIALEKDAEKLSETFGFKITQLNESIIKCDFPIKRLDYYIDLLTKKNITFEIINNNYTKIDNYSDYLNNQNLKSIIDSIIELDMDNITFKKSFEFLNTLNEKLKKIYN